VAVTPAATRDLTVRPGGIRAARSWTTCFLRPDHRRQKHNVIIRRLRIKPQTKLLIWATKYHISSTYQLLLPTKYLISNKMATLTNKISNQQQNGYSYQQNI
jgi:hypothetical protein